MDPSNDPNLQELEVNAQDKLHRMQRRTAVQVTKTLADPHVDSLSAHTRNATVMLHCGHVVIARWACYLSDDVEAICKCRC